MGPTYLNAYTDSLYQRVNCLEDWLDTIQDSTVALLDDSLHLTYCQRQSRHLRVHHTIAIIKGEKSIHLWTSSNKRKKCIHKSTYYKTTPRVVPASSRYTNRPFLILLMFGFFLFFFLFSGFLLFLINLLSISIFLCLSFSGVIFFLPHLLFSPIRFF